MNLSVPGAPTNVTAVAGNAQVLVYFTPPTSFGGTPINYYTVKSAGTLVATAKGTSSPILVTGLYNSYLTHPTSYTFTVTATNDVGTSVASSPSASVSPVYSYDNSGFTIVGAGPYSNNSWTNSEVPDVFLNSPYPASVGSYNPGDKVNIQGSYYYAACSNGSGLTGYVYIKPISLASGEPDILSEAPALGTLDSFNYTISTIKNKIGGVNSLVLKYSSKTQGAVACNGHPTAGDQVCESIDFSSSFVIPSNTAPGIYRLYIYANNNALDTGPATVGGYPTATQVLGYQDIQVGDLCTDGKKDGTETGIDCGGSCSACTYGTCGLSLNTIATSSYTTPLGGTTSLVNIFVNIINNSGKDFGGSDNATLSGVSPVTHTDTNQDFFTWYLYSPWTWMYTKSKTTLTYNDIKYPTENISVPSLTKGASTTIEIDRLLLPQDGAPALSLSDIQFKLDCPAFSASCSVSTPSALVNQVVTWMATSTGAVGPVSYKWIGDEFVNGNTDANVSGTYSTSTPSVKHAKVTVSDGVSTSIIGCPGTNIGGGGGITVTDSVYDGSCPPGVVYYPSKPINGFCNLGDSTDVTGSPDGPWSWSCIGNGTGHTDDNCTASIMSPLDPTLVCNLAMTPSSSTVSVNYNTTWTVNSTAPFSQTRWTTHNSLGTSTPITLPGNTLNKIFTTVGLTTVTAEVASSTSGVFGPPCTATTSVFFGGVGSTTER